MAAKGDSLTQKCAGGVTMLRLGDLLTPYKDLNRGGGAPVAAVGRYGIRLRDEIYSKQLAKDTSKNRLIFKGTLTVGMGSKQIDIGILSEDKCYAVSPAYHTYRITGVNFDYLRYCLEARNSDMSKRYMIASCRQGKTIDFKSWLDYEIPVHEERGQLLIRDVLDQICELKKNAETQIEKLDILVKSRFVEMFGDFATNQNQWSLVSFDDVAEIEGGLTTDFLRYSNCPHIGIDSIEKDTGALKGYRTVEEDKLTSGKYHFTSRHIIYSKIRPNLNKVAVPTFEGLCSADAYAILPRENVERLFLAFVMRSKYFLDYIIPLSGRSGMPKANQMQVRGFHFPLPPLSLQREFAAFVEKVDKLKDVAKKSVEQMDTLYRAKLQEYFG